MYKTPVVLTWQCRNDVASPPGPTRTHASAYVAHNKRAKLIGPTGIVDPREIKRCVLGPEGDTNLEGHHSLYRQHFLPFSSVWD